MGPGGVVYLLTTALILGTSIYTQANLLFWGFGLMVGGLVASVLIVWQSMRKMQIQRLLPAHGVAGRPLTLRYLVTWFPIFSLLITEEQSRPLEATASPLRSQAFGWVMHLGPRQTIQAEAALWPMRRGEIHFERIAVSSSFPFGVLRKTVSFDQPGTLLIYPHLYKMKRRVIDALSRIDPVGRKHLERSGGSGEFFGLREYRAGDSLKIVDWKRSARTGDLVAREMAQPSPPRIMLLLDLTSRDPGQRHNGDDFTHEQIDRAIALAASVVCDAYLNHCQIGLIARGADCPAFPMHHSLPHRTRILDALARLTRSDPRGFEPWSVEPTVIVRPGRGEPLSRGRRQELGADDLERYVVDAGGTDLLTRRAKPRASSNLGRARIPSHT